MTSYNIYKARDIMTKNGLQNVTAIFAAATNVGLSLPGACALMAKESSGQNIYGHDDGGALSGFPVEVNKGNWDVFWWMVHDIGHTSNGVGPAQLTNPGFFDQMLAKGRKPWVALDNMEEGFAALKGYYDALVKADSKHPWVEAGTRYNGSHDYGVELADLVHQWAVLLRPALIS